MRGYRPGQPSLVSPINVEALIAADYPIRSIKRMCDDVLRPLPCAQSHKSTQATNPPIRFCKT